MPPTEIEIAGLNKSIAELNRRFDNSDKKDDAAKQWTRPELSALVAEGKLGQDEADTIMDDQLTKNAVLAASEAATNTIKDTKIAGDSNEIISRYVAANGDIKIEGSETRLRVNKEYAALVAKGMPTTVATEELALERALGPVDAYEKAREGGQDNNDAGNHQDSTGGGDGGNGGGGGGGGDSKKAHDDAANAPGYLSTDEKRHYADQIQRGIMKDWNDVHAEMQFSSERIRAQNGAPNAVTGRAA